MSCLLLFPGPAEKTPIGRLFFKELLGVSCNSGAFNARGKNAMSGTVPEKCVSSHGSTVDGASWPLWSCVQGAWLPPDRIPLPLARESWNEWKQGSRRPS